MAIVFMSLYFKKIKILVTTKLVYPKIIEKKISKNILLPMNYLAKSIPTQFQSIRLRPSCTELVQYSLFSRVRQLGQLTAFC